jgi:beta-glucuronidase
VLSRLIGVVVAAGAFACAAPAGAQDVPAPSSPVAGPAPSSVVSTPSSRTLYEDGPSRRFLVDGPWLYRPDPAFNGDGQGWQRDPSTTGWSVVGVPNAWNATDESAASFAGAVGWYRKDFRLPSASRRLMWTARFESVNYRVTMWLNGRFLGSHEGAYAPFELRLPRGFLKRTGVNRLVLRVDSRRDAADFPPAKFDVRGRPLGGWWNYGGILREVYLRGIEDIDFDQVDVRPDLPCASCAATVTWNVRVRNAGTRSRTVSVIGRFGAQRVRLGRVALRPKSTVSLTRTLRVARPKLWSPDRPYLYDASLRAVSGSRTLQTFTRKVGVRSIKVSEGRLLLNGRPLNVRGVGVQEDSRTRGFAIDNATRDQQIARTRELGAGLIRAHYPLHPYTLERADRLGLLVWSEVPVYQVDTEELAKAQVRDAAVAVLEASILADRNHPSIITWSIANELSARPGPSQEAYIRRATATAKALDPTRPVSLAYAAAPGVGCQAEYASLDILGVNDYFGWYPGPNGSIADRDLLSEYLDSVRACYPQKAIIVSEFGAEANRDGPVEERGTHQFQQDFIAFHHGVYASKPWLSGAIYWALQEFRVRPGWDGGNPRALPPLHQKGVVTFDGAPKPAFATLQQLFRSTSQIAPPGG